MTKKYTKEEIEAYHKAWSAGNNKVLKSKKSTKKTNKKK